MLSKRAEAVAIKPDTDAEQKGRGQEGHREGVNVRGAMKGCKE